MWRDGETPDLPSEWCFSGSEYPEYGKPFKSRLQRKKMPKIDLYPDSKLPCLSIVQSKENRLPHRPIDSAIGTGGLDLLIAHALMILCHSLFEVVILALFCGFFVNLIKKSLTTRFGQNSEIYPD